MLLAADKTRHCFCMGCTLSLSAPAFYNAALFHQLAVVAFAGIENDSSDRKLPFHFLPMLEVRMAEL